MTPKTKFYTLALMLLLVFSVLSSVAIPCLAATGTGEGSMTNIPDTDIGGATGGLDTSDVTLLPDMSSEPDTESDTVRVTDKDTTADRPTDTTSMTEDDDGGIGWIGIVIAVAVIAAIIIVILAMMPKKKDM